MSAYQLCLCQQKPTMLQSTIRELISISTLQVRKWSCTKFPLIIVTAVNSRIVSNHYLKYTSASFFDTGYIHCMWIWIVLSFYEQEFSLVLVLYNCILHLIILAGSSDLRLSQPPSVFQLPPLPQKSVSLKYTLHSKTNCINLYSCLNFIAVEGL